MGLSSIGSSSRVVDTEIPQALAAGGVDDATGAGAGSGAGGKGAAKRATVGGTKDGASGAGGNSGAT